MLYLWVNKWQIRYFASWANKLFCVSRAVERVLNANGLKNTVTLYSSTLVTPVKHKRQKYPTLLYVGRVVGRKGLKAVIQALPLLPNVQFLIGGHLKRYDTISSEYKPLKQLAEQLGVSDRVKFLGPLDNKVLSKYYAQADAAILLVDYFEPFSRLLVEATAAGLPVIASSQGGNPEIVDGNGMIVKNPNNPNTVAAAVRNVLKNRENMGKAAIKLAKLFTPEAAGKRMVKYYESRAQKC